MSLSEFIELPDFKVKLKQEFVKPRIELDKPLIAPVIASNSQEIGIIVRGKKQEWGI